METNRADDRAGAVSTPHGFDELPARSPAQWPDQDVAEPGETAVVQLERGWIGMRGQRFERATMAVGEGPATILSNTGVHGPRAVDGSHLFGPELSSIAVELRCGGCGATIALAQRVRQDGHLFDYVLDAHESCGVLVASGEGWCADV